MKQIRFYFSIASSHSAAEHDYSGSYITLLTGGDFFSQAHCFGYHVINASISSEDRRYHVTVELESEINIYDAVSFLENFASFTTYLLSINQNHFYGSPFIDVAYGEFYRDNGDGIRDHLNLKVTRKIGTDLFPSTIPELHELVHFFFLGMQSNNVKAKYFNLFLIFEALEASPLGRSMYADETLFTENDKHLVRDLANKLEGERKISAILGLLSRTEAPRHVKLCGILNRLGILDFKQFEGQPAVLVTPDITKKLIDARNKLFHKGNSVDENLIWGTLIPIAQCVVAELISNPFVLMQSAGTA